MSASDIDDTGPEEPGQTAYVAPPVQRAIRLLRHIADGETVANMSRAAEKLGINRTTLVRLLHTLESERFIEKLPAGGYRIGLGLVGLAAKSSYSQDLVQTALPIVTRLAEHTGLSAHLGLLDGTEALYVARQSPSVPLASNLKVGHRIPAHATTLGRIILAYRTKADVEALYSGKALARFTGKTPANMDDLHKVLAQERATGVAWSSSYYAEGVSSLAAAIFDANGEAVAAINVAGPSALFDEGQGRRERIATAVRAAAREISQRLGLPADGFSSRAG
jgi:DNA-binding IclR family transcriptional regulator